MLTKYSVRRSLQWFPKIDLLGNYRRVAGFVGPNPISALFFIVDYQIHKQAPPLNGDADFYRSPPIRVLVSAFDANSIFDIVQANVNLADGETIDIIRVYPTPESNAMPYFQGASF
jgi:hypothetical protein